MRPAWRSAILVLAAACSHATGTGTNGGGAPPPSPKPTVDAGAIPREARLIRLHPAASARYALYRRDSVTVQMPSGESQVQTVGRTAYLSVVAAAAGSEYGLTITVDSIRLDDDAVFPQIMIDSAVGARWTGRLRADGHVVDLSSPNTSLVAAQLKAQLRLIFPMLPVSGVQEPLEWSDTTQTPVKASTFDAVEAAVTHYRASNEDFRGRRALRIDGTRDGRLSGTMNQFGQSMSLSGTAGAEIAYHLGQDGTLLGAEGTETTDMTITVESVGQAVPARQLARFTLTSIP